MPLIKKLNNDNYVGLYEEDNFRIWAKTALYESVGDMKQYEIVTSIVITKSDSPIYKAANLHIPVNQEGLISIVNYVEKITAYVKDAEKNNIDMYWQKLFLDKFFVELNTVKIDVFYNRYQREQRQEEEYKEIQEIRNTIEGLKEEIKEKYNSKSQAVVYDLHSLIILIEDKKLLPLQNNQGFKDMVINNTSELVDKNTYKRIKLNWSQSDIEILKNVI